MDWPSAAVRLPRVITTHTPARASATPSQRLRLSRSCSSQAARQMVTTGLSAMISEVRLAGSCASAPRKKRL
jgi:hypothetical protein